MNHDGQLCGLLRAELPDLAPRLASVAYLDGLPFTADQVLAWLEPHLPPRAAAPDPDRRATAAPLAAGAPAGGDA